MWLLFAVMSGLFSTASGLITRHILRKNSDAWAFSFFFSFIGALTSLLFFILSPRFPISFGFPWILMGIVGAFIVVQNLLNFSSSKHLVTKLLAVAGATIGVILIKIA